MVQEKESQEKSSKQKLHNLLVEEGLYSKTIEEFDTQFSNPESRNKLHSLLTEKNLYSKSSEDFNTQFFPVNTPVVEDKEPLKTPTAEEFEALSNIHPDSEQFKENVKNRPEDKITKDKFGSEGVTEYQKRGKASLGDATTEDVYFGEETDEKYVALTREMRDVAQLSEGGVNDINLKYNNTASGDFSTWDAIRSAFGETPLGSSLGVDSIDDVLLGATVSNRNADLAQSIRDKQSDFMKGMVPDEVPAFKDYLVKRGAKLKDDLMHADFMNESVRPSKN